MKFHRLLAPVAPLVLAALTISLTGGRAARAQAVSYSANFDSGSVAAPGTLNGTAKIVPAAALPRPPFPTGNANLALELTPAVNYQEGTFNIGPLTSQSITSFDASFDMAIGFGTGNPANGMSFNVGPFATNSLYGEYGVGSLLAVTFNTYNNFQGNSYNMIGVMHNNAQIAVSGQSDSIDLADYQPHHVDISYNGAASTLTVSYGNVDGSGNTDSFTVNNFKLGSTGEDVFGFGGRTGGLNEYNLLDNVAITVNGSPGVFVPAPAALPLFAGGLAGMGAWLLRRRKPALSAV